VKLRLAIEWFLNPDHLPFIVAMRRGFFERRGIEFVLIEPTEHYDGLSELLEGNIELATNEPLHLIEQFDHRFLSLGRFFETEGGVLLKASSYEKLLQGETITVTTPVSNPTTDAIGYEIIRRFYLKAGVNVYREQVVFVPNGFEHIRYLQEGADAAWLYFYNFEGIEAAHAGLDVLYLDARNAGFANFSALDIFVNRSFYQQHKAECSAFLQAVRESIAFIRTFPEEAMEDYYAYTQTAPSALSDDILRSTIGCFDEYFVSDHLRSLPILEFFTEIGITDLKPEHFKTAFLH